MGQIFDSHLVGPLTQGMVLKINPFNNGSVQTYSENFIQIQWFMQSFWSYFVHKQTHES